MHGNQGPQSGCCLGANSERPMPSRCYHPGLRPTTGLGPGLGGLALASDKCQKSPSAGLEIVPMCMCIFAIAAFAALTGTLTTSPELEAIREPLLTCGSGHPEFRPLSPPLPVSLWSSCVF